MNLNHIEVVLIPFISGHRFEQFRTGKVRLSYRLNPFHISCSTARRATRDA